MCHATPDYQGATLRGGIAATVVEYYKVKFCHPD